MPVLTLTKSGANGKAHNWLHVLTPLTELETLLNTTKLDYLNIQTNGLKTTNIRAHAGVNQGRQKVRNATGGTLTAGTLINFADTYNDGTDNYPSIVKAVSTVLPATTFYAHGIVEADISNNADGTVCSALEISGIDTSLLTTKRPVFLSSTAGSYTQDLTTLDGYGIQVVGFVSTISASIGRIVFGNWSIGQKGLQWDI